MLTHHPRRIGRAEPSERAGESASGGFARPTCPVARSVQFAINRGIVACVSARMEGLPARRSLTVGAGLVAASPSCGSNSSRSADQGARANTDAAAITSDGGGSVARGRQRRRTAWPGGRDGTRRGRRRRRAGRDSVGRRDGARGGRLWQCQRRIFHPGVRDERVGPDPALRSRRTRPSCRVRTTWSSSPRGSIRMPMDPVRRLRRS